ncbi:AGAP011366-PA-like protein [Anopheles sinensis]|uniref:AGAP011366-PA-like protein n=1 Tax=Anopheles sinensis TaxID=74873 RepID=A0A084WAH7_ANOSI|nr:AGAP011366-PA-like protein [Anopheles sinensis]
MTVINAPYLNLQGSGKGSIPFAVESMLDMEAAANGDIMKMIPGLIDVRSLMTKENISVSSGWLSTPQTHTE